MGSPSSPMKKVELIGILKDVPLKIHPVCLPPERTTLQKFTHRCSEIFFPEDPLYKFRNQTFGRKVFTFFQNFFPILRWLPRYNLTLLRSDLVAGLTIATLAIPQGISYAKLANLPPIVGLYTSFVPPLIYSTLGSSRHLGIGPVAIGSLIMGTMLGEEISPINEPELYFRIALSASFFAGLFQACMGIFRLGFIVDYLSKATLVGFMAGAAIIVSLQQLKGLLGIVHFTGQMQIIPVLSSVFNHKEEWTWETVAMGISFLVFLLATRLLSLKKPKLFWVSAASPLVSVVVSTVFVFAMKSQAENISIIGALPKGLNPISVEKLYFKGPHLGFCIKLGLVTGLLALTEGIAVGRTLAASNNYRIDGNKEMRALGITNLIGSCTSCYVASGSFSRSAVNYNAGAKTAVSNIVMAATVLVTLLFLMPLFHYTPNVVLSAIIITAVIGLFDYNAIMRLWRIDQLDFLACLCSFFGVLFLSVQTGLAIAIGVSMFKVLLHVTRPTTRVLGKIPGTQIYQNVNQYGNAERVPAFLVLSIESPIYFANANYILERILRWIREEEDWIQENDGTELKVVILDMRAVTAIDTSGLDAIAELHRTLEKRSLQLVLVSPIGDVMSKLHTSKILDIFVSNGLYLTVGEAIADISSYWKP